MLLRYEVLEAAVLRHGASQTARSSSGGAKGKANSSCSRCGQATPGLRRDAVLIVELVVGHEWDADTLSCAFCLR